MAASFARAQLLKKANFTAGLQGYRGGDSSSESSTSQVQETTTNTYTQNVDRRVAAGNGSVILDAGGGATNVQLLDGGSIGLASRAVGLAEMSSQNAIDLAAAFGTNSAALAGAFGANAAALSDNLGMRATSLAEGVSGKGFSLGSDAIQLATHAVNQLSTFVGRTLDAAGRNQAFAETIATKSGELYENAVDKENNATQKLNSNTVLLLALVGGAVMIAKAK